MAGLPRHGPFEFRIGRTELVFVGAVIAPEAIGGGSLLNGLDDSQVCREGEHLGFGEVRDGRKVDTSIPVLGVKTHPKVFDFVACAGDQGTGTLPE